MSSDTETETIIWAMNDARQKKHLMEITIDLDGQSADIDFKTVTEYLLKMQKTNRVELIFYRHSSSGTGYHITFFLKIPVALRDYKESKEMFFMVRYLMMDDIARISADYRRSLSGAGQGELMQLFEGKTYYDIETGQTHYGHCEDWRLLY